MPTLMLVDDNSSYKKAFRNLLVGTRWVVCGEVDCGEDALAMFEKCNPTIIVMDFSMAGMNGVTASIVVLRENPEALIFMLTANATRQLKEYARRSGIRGFCDKARSERIVIGLNRLLDGEEYFD